MPSKDDFKKLQQGNNRLKKKLEDMNAQKGQSIVALEKRANPRYQ